MHGFRVLAVSLTLTAGAVSGLAAGKGDAEKGKGVFQRCAICHNADSGEKKIGPGLKGLFKKDKLANGKKTNEANVRAVVDEGGSGMPQYKEALTDREKDDLVAYLKTL